MRVSDRGRPELDDDLPQLLVPGSVLLPVDPLRPNRSEYARVNKSGSEFNEWVRVQRIGKSTNNRQAQEIAPP